jgi:hypothetical protein
MHHFDIQHSKRNSQGWKNRRGREKKSLSRYLVHAECYTSRQLRNAVPQVMAKENRTSDTHIFSRFYSLPPERGIVISSPTAPLVHQARPR